MKRYAHPIAGIRARRRDGEGGFTLLEVIVSIAVLSAIVAPLTMAVVQMFRQSGDVESRLNHSADAQRIGAAWVRDVQSLDRVGTDNLGTCAGATGTDLVTFYWNQSPPDASTLQDTMQPESATWAVVGTGEGMRLVRRHCVAGVLQGGAEQVLATHIGLPGKSPRDIVFGTAGPGADKPIYCPDSPSTPNAGTYCRLSIDGSFKYTVQATRRVSGAPSNDAPPPPPTITGATPRNQGVSVAWLPTVSPVGITPTTGYRVEAWTSPTGGLAGSTEIIASSNAGDVFGLTNGTPYWIVVYAKNQAGYGDPSEVYGPVTPEYTVPTLPLSVVATPGPVSAPGTIDLTWAPPSDNGGLPISAYQIVVTPTTGPAIPTVTVGGTDLSATISGLQANTTYSFKIRASNSLGYGPYSDPASASTRPSKPVPVTAGGGPGRAIVGFTLSGNGNLKLAATGAVRITATCVVASGSCTDRTFEMNHPTPDNVNTAVTGLDTATATPATLLVNGQSYSVTVEVKNTDGNWGPKSDPVTVTPVTTPAPPSTTVSITSSGVSQTLNFSLGLPDSGGSTITTFEVTETSSGRKVVVPAGSGTTTFAWSPATTTDPVGGVNFQNFTTYGFVIKACNSVGCSAGSMIYNAQPGITPVAGGVTVTAGSQPKSVVASPSLSPASSGYAATEWAVQCPGASLTTGLGVNPSIQVANVNTGSQTCTATPTNKLLRVIAGNGSYLSLAGNTVTSNAVSVYDKPAKPLAPTLTLPTTGTVNKLTLTLGANQPSGGPSPNLTYVATCTGSSVAPEAAPGSTGPRTMPGLTPGTTTSCTVVAYNVAGIPSDPSDPTTIKLQRVLSIEAVAGNQNLTIPDSGGAPAVVGQLLMLVTVRHDPGTVVQSIQGTLKSGTTGTWAQHQVSSVASGNDVLSRMWVMVTPPSGHWVDPGNPGAIALSADLTATVAINSTDTASRSTTANRTYNYWAAAEWDTDKAMPVSYNRYDSTPGTSPAVNAGTTLVAGNAIRIHYSCDDNDGGSGGAGQCDSVTIRVRNLDTGGTIDLACSARLSDNGNTPCETRSGATIGYFNADDNTERNYTIGVPNGVTTGRYLIEGRFCNENSTCPASGPAGYGGNDYQAFGWFNVS